MAETKNELYKIEDYLYVDAGDLKRSTLEWIAERQAQKRYTKGIDAVFLKDKKFYDYNASKKIHDLFAEQQINDKVFYKTEKQLSFNDGKLDGAIAVWTIDVDSTEPIIRLAEQVISTTEFKNKVVEVQLMIKQITYEDTDYHIVETRNKDQILREIGRISNNEFVPLTTEENQELPDEVKEQLSELDLGIKEWTGTFEPFVYLENNPEAKSDRNYIETELEDLVVLAQKKRDDIHYSSVKIESTGLKNKNADKKGSGGNADDQAETNARKLASSSIITRENGALEGTPAVGIVNAVPNTNTYDSAIRTIMNTILKKTGGATDVDAKGTVQQSKGELLMSQGDEYKVSNWKKTNRQNKVKELIEKIVKTYKEIFKSTDFDEVKYVFAFISQEEVLSEREQLENAKLAKDLNITSELLIQARYHNMTILEMFEYGNISFEVEKNE